MLWSLVLQRPRLAQGIVVAHRPLLQRVDALALHVGGEQALVERPGRLVEVGLL